MAISENILNYPSAVLHHLTSILDICFLIMQAVIHYVKENNRFSQKYAMDLLGHIIQIFIVVVQGIYYDENFSSQDNLIEQFMVKFIEFIQTVISVKTPSRTILIDLLYLFCDFHGKKKNLNILNVQFVQGVGQILANNYDMNEPKIQELVTYLKNVFNLN